jgi:hypothetical protein
MDHLVSSGTLKIGMQIIEATISAFVSSRGFPESSVSSKARSDFLSLICTQQQTFKEIY